jgi:NTE family protein
MKIGLALGSGSSRGWSHIGVINALADYGIEPEIICGTSVGALVGAAFTAGNLRQLEQWVTSLTRRETARYFRLNYSLTGFVHTDRFHQFLNEYVAPDTTLIEEQPKRFASVATELATGREIWFTRGLLLEAVWASISLPGLFPAIRHNDRWLVDGGLVNPVPVSVCRALGADLVIAVNLNGDIMRRYSNLSRRITPVEVKQEMDRSELETATRGGVVNRISDMVSDYRSTLFAGSKRPDQAPNLFEALIRSVNITQDRITRSRMAGDPPDILIAPKLSQIGLLEFYRGVEAIEEGRKSVERVLPEIESALRGF